MRPFAPVTDGAECLVDDDDDDDDDNTLQRDKSTCVQKTGVPWRVHAPALEKCGGVLLVRGTQLLSGSARGCSQRHQGRGR